MNVRRPRAGGSASRHRRVPPERRPAVAGEEERHPTRTPMFRFSISNTAEVDINAGELETANVGRDDDFAERLRRTDDYRDDETVFRAENRNPETVEEAVAFVQGLFFPRTRPGVAGRRRRRAGSDRRTRQPGHQAAVLSRSTPGEALV